MSTSFQPFYDRVLVRRIDEASSPTSLISIPDPLKEPPLVGCVIAIGHGRLFSDGLVPLTAKPGDRVYFGKFAGTDINIDGEELLIMREEEILGRAVTGE